MDNIAEPIASAPSNLDAQEFAKLDVLGRLDAIEKGLLTADPQIPVHLSSILKTLHTYEELIHLMDDSKTKILMDGMQKYRKIELVKEALKTRGKGKGTTVDDI